MVPMIVTHFSVARMALSTLFAIGFFTIKPSKPPKLRSNIFQNMFWKVNFEYWGWTRQIKKSSMTSHNQNIFTGQDFCSGIVMCRPLVPGWSWAQKELLTVGKNSLQTLEANSKLSTIFNKNTSGNEEWIIVKKWLFVAQSSYFSHFIIIRLLFRTAQDDNFPIALAFLKADQPLWPLLSKLPNDIDFEAELKTTTWSWAKHFHRLRSINNEQSSKSYWNNTFITICRTIVRFFTFYVYKTDNVNLINLWPLINRGTRIEWLLQICHLAFFTTKQSKPPNDIDLEDELKTKAWPWWRPELEADILVIFPPVPRFKRAFHLRPKSNE
jgi:hypothetical protein